MLERVKRKWAAFRALPRNHRRVLLASAAWLPLFWLALHTLGLARLQRLLGADVGEPATGQVPVDVRQIDRMVGIAARHSLAPVTCLTRSLLLDWLLRRQGLASQLRIGVRVIDGALEAHAWVELQGLPVNDQSDVAQRFAPFGQHIPSTSFDRP